MELALPGFLVWSGAAFDKEIGGGVRLKYGALFNVSIFII